MKCHPPRFLLAAVPAVLLCGALAAVPAAGQTSSPPSNTPAAAPASGEERDARDEREARDERGVATPGDYVIGPDDVLGVVFWRDADLSTEVTVRPDGQITLPLLNDIHAAGLTPEELRLEVKEAASRYVEEPTVTVVVRQINSRRVFITGQVAKPGVYPLTSPITVMQLITMAGGLLEWAKERDILVMRTENGRTVSFRFNYRDVSRGRGLRQNIELKPGDTIVVP